MGYSKFIKHSLTAATFAASFAVSATPNTTIDIMVLYSDGIANQYGSGLDSRINQIINVSNSVFEDSLLDVELRLVHKQQVSYDDNAQPQAVLEDLTCDFNELQIQGSCSRGNAFSQVSELRAQYGADMVVMLRPYSSSHGGVCGIAWIGGSNTEGDFSHSIWKETAMSVVGVDGPCADWVTAHELGHNMGLTHSAYQDSRGGTFSWAWGHGQANDFATIMSYAWVYGNQTRKVYNFSTPNLDCYGSPCGIDRNEANGADAVHALSHTAPLIANYVETVVDEIDEEVPDNQPPSDTTDSLKEKWQQEKAKLQELKQVRAEKKEVLKQAKADFKAANKAYNSAFKAYEKSVKRLNRLLEKANQAIENYNASGDLSATKQQRLYNKAMNAVNAYNAQVDVVNANAQEVNNLAPVFEAAIESFNNAQADFEQAKANVIAQKEIVKQARDAYIAAQG